MIHITRKEWIRVIGFALFVVALTTLPYLLAWSQQTPDHAFSGALFGVEDANSYLAKMRIGVRGEWAFSLFYTPEPTDPAPLVFLPYIAAGQVIRLLVHDPALIPAALMIAFQVMRVVCDVLLVLALYRFVAQFVTHERVRYNAMALACLAGGLGWLTVLFPIHAAAMPDITIPEGFGFLVLYGLPHLALARAAMLIGFVCLMPASEDGERRGLARQTPTQESAQSVGVQHAAPLHVTFSGRRVRQIILAGILFNLVGLCVPFYLAVIYVILGVWGLAGWILQRRFPVVLFWRAVIAAGMTLPLFIYNALIFSVNPAFAQWSAQNNLQSPPVWEYIFAYAPIALWAALAVRFFARRAHTQVENALLIGWIIAVPLLVYLPINVQRRLAEGVIMPLAILAAWGIRQWVWGDQVGGWRANPLQQDLISARHETTHRRGLRTVITLGIVTFLCATSILWVATGSLASVLRSSPTYIQGEQMRALAWLQANAQPGDRVLAAWATGNMLPVYTDLRPFLGLGPETMLAESKRDLTIQYFIGAMTPAGREVIYQQPCTPMWTLTQYQTPPNCRIHYVLWGVNEHALIAAAHPEIDPAAAEASWSQGLTLVYEDGDTRIYQVPDLANPS